MTAFLVSDHDAFLLDSPAQNDLDGGLALLLSEAMNEGQS